MELRPHDLIEIKDVESFLSRGFIPEWVQSSLRAAPFAVVRRAPMEGEWIPIGIRGRARHERHAGLLKLSEIKQVTKPETIADKELWKKTARSIPVLDEIQIIMKRLNIPWGPTGSVGFELVTSHLAMHENSDIDLILRCEAPLGLEVSKMLYEKLSLLPIRIDALIEMPYGAYALAEYAQGEASILLRTKEGPKLVSHPCHG
jgi:phosphoribosyl-dephospho-CoA transferase